MRLVRYSQTALESAFLRYFPADYWGLTVKAWYTEPDPAREADFGIVKRGRTNTADEFISTASISFDRDRCEKPQGRTSEVVVLMAEQVVCPVK